MCDGVLRLDGALPLLPEAIRPLVSRLDLSLSPGDGMMVPGGDTHYLTCGASALNVILAALSLSGTAKPRDILDFGAGAGRITRWLRAAFPEARIAACDLRREDVAFCRAHFADETWESGTDIEALAAPGRYGLVWAGSVLTHLPERQCLQLLDKLMSWTAPDGLVVVSTAGRLPASARKDAYIHPAGWQRVMNGWATDGFGYADYDEGGGYGFTLAKPSWIASHVERNQDVRMVMQAEAVWDGHQDVVAIQNRPIAPGAVPGNRSAGFVANFETKTPQARFGWLRRARA